MEKDLPPGKLRSSIPPMNKKRRNQVLAILFWVAFSDYGPTFSPRTQKTKIAVAER